MLLSPNLLGIKKIIFKKNVNLKALLVDEISVILKVTLNELKVNMQNIR